MPIVKKYTSVVVVNCSEPEKYKLLDWVNNNTKGSVSIIFAENSKEEIRLEFDNVNDALYFKIHNSINSAG